MPYIANTDNDRQEMLGYLGLTNIDQLFDVIPKNLRLTRELNLPPALPASELIGYFEELAKENTVVPGSRCLAGGGVYPHFIPPVVKELVHRGEFYTSYTPYQPEVSQGMLQSIFEYQSYICVLTGMDATNASSYDGASALSDAIVMARNISRHNRIILFPYVNPLYKEVIQTYNLAKGGGVELAELEAEVDGTVSLSRFEAELKKGDVAGVVIQIPNFLGFYEEEVLAYSELTKKYGALVIMAVYPFVLGVIKSPVELGADIVVGEGQPLGIPLGFGGPLLGFIATKKEYMRQLPGRIIGKAKAQGGKSGYVMTLQAREQHIRREKATSSICTNEALLALQAAVYLGAVGKSGFHSISRACEENAHYAFRLLTSLEGVDAVYPQRKFFNEFALRLELAKTVDEVYSALLARGWIPGIKLGDFYGWMDSCLLLSFTELHTRKIIDQFVKDFQEVMS